MAAFPDPYHPVYPVGQDVMADPTAFSMITFHPSQIEGSRSATQAISKSVAKGNFELTSTYLNAFELNNCLAGSPWMLSRLSVAPSRNRFFVLRVHIHRVDHGNVPPQGLANRSSFHAIPTETYRNTLALQPRNMRNHTFLAWD